MLAPVQKGARAEEMTILPHQAKVPAMHRMQIEELYRNLLFPAQDRGVASPGTLGLAELRLGAALPYSVSIRLLIF
jgi:hypothetical protein